MANFEFLSYDDTHKYVEQAQKRGQNVWWDGYDVMIWKPNPNGYSRTDGLFRNGKWGTVARVKPRKSGYWRLLVVRPVR